MIPTRYLVCLAPSLCAFAASTAHATDGTWSTDVAGNWSDATKWTSSNIADGTDAIADFSTLNIAAGRAVTLDSSRTVGTLKLDDTGATGDSGWTFSTANASILTLATNSGTPGITMGTTGVPGTIVNHNINHAVAGTQGFTLSGATNSVGLGGDLSGLSGPVTITSGRLNLGTGISLGGITSVDVASGGQLGIWNAGGNYNQSLTIAGTGYGEVGFEAAMRLGNASANVTLGGPLTLSGDATIGGRNGAGFANTFNGAIGESGGSRALTLGTASLNTGTYVFTGSNTYTGGTTLALGTLKLDYTTNNTSKISGTSALTLANGTVLQLTGNASADTTQNTGGLTLTGSSSMALATQPGRMLTADFTANGGVLTRAANASLEVVNTGTGTAQVKPGIAASTAFVPWATYNGTFAGTDASGYLIAASTANTTATDLTSWVTGATQYTTTGAAFTGSVGTVAIDGITFKDAAARTVAIGAANTLTLNQGVIVASTVGNNASVISGGLIQGPASSGVIDLLNSNTASNLHLSSVIQDNGSTATSLVKNGPGTVALSGANTYTGGVTVNGGTLSAGNNTGTGATALGSSTATVNTGGTLQFWVNTGTGGTTFANNITLNGGTLLSQDGVNKLSGTITIGATGGTLRSQWANKNLVIDGVITGAGPVTIDKLTGDGGSKVIFTAANTYTGPTTITGGVLQLAKQVSLYNNTPALWTAPNLTVASGATAALNVGGTGEFTSVDIDTIAGLTNVGAVTATQGFKNGSILGLDTTNAGGNFTYANVLANHVGTVTDTLGLTKLGTGTLTLTGVNTYTGATTISGGTLLIGGAGSLNSGAYAGTIANAGTFNYASSAAQTLSGGFSGAGAMTKSGAGTLTFSSQKTYTGATTVSQGILDLTGGGGVNGTIRGVATISTGATLRLSTGDATGYDPTTRLSTIHLTGGTLNVNTTANQTLGNATINMTGASITGIAASNLDFFNGTSALNTLASATTSTISGVKVNLRQNNGVTFTVAQGTTASGNDLDISSVISNSTGFTNNILTKTGAGTMRLLSTNTYTGGTTVSQGVLDLAGGGGNNGTIRGAVTVNAGATLRLSTGDATGYDGTTRLSTINLVGGTLNVNSTANQTLGSATINMTGASITGIPGSNFDFFAGASALNTLASSTTSTISGVALSPLRQGNTTFTVAPGTTGSGIDLNIQSVLRTSPSGDPANAVLTIAGGGTVAFSGVNTYTRNTVVSAGTLILADNASLRFAIGNASGVSNTLTGAGTATLNGDFALDLTAAAALASGTWVLENVTSLTGPYGASFQVTDTTGAAWTDAGSDKWTKTTGTQAWSFDETTGTLTLTVATSGYDTWASVIADPNDRDRTDDPDGDGFLNIEEFLFGTSPVGNNGSLLSSTQSGSTLVLRWLQLESGGTYVLKKNATLSGGAWTAVASPVPALDANQTGAPAGYDYYTVTLPIGAGSDFFRIEAAEN